MARPGNVPKNFWKMQLELDTIDFYPDFLKKAIMVIDGETVITRSFNVTKDAEDKNTENLLVILNLLITTF